MTSARSLLRGLALVGLCAVGLLAGAYVLVIALLIGIEAGAGPLAGFAVIGCVAGLFAAAGADSFGVALGRWLAVSIILAGGMAVQVSAYGGAARALDGVPPAIAAATAMAALGLACGLIGRSRWSLAASVAAAGAFALLLPIGSRLDAIPHNGQLALAAVRFCGPWLLAAAGAELGVRAARRLPRPRQSADRV